MRRARSTGWSSGGRPSRLTADADQIKALTRAVNDGPNGIADRKAALARARIILLWRRDKPRSSDPGSE